MTVHALPEEALEVNRQFLQLLRQTMAEKGLRVAEVARRLGRKPDYLYKRLSDDTRTLRLSFCAEVLLACEVAPADFFRTAIAKDGNVSKETTPPAPLSLRQLVEPVVMEVLERQALRERPEEKTGAGDTPLAHKKNPEGGR